ncbi:MAG TPA: RNA polymerase sigma factor [Baekduia sp.]|uniref:RNA polymerase sigma factor n=1 Tax=Baekduia sp. TaxID=2600305 RepID=UPI002D789F9D|nr:RNA polymerase sigma factor [Baekduia sp.]HET6505203.1 RNA polymerase sigma factor [Baekduia sp.]
MGRGLFVQARKDPSRFDDVYIAYHRTVVRYLAHRTHDVEAACDLAAETFVQMYMSLDGFRGSTEDEGRAWMWTIARHQLYRWRERRLAEAQHLARLVLVAADLGEAEYERVEQLTDVERFRPVLDRALTQLPDETRRILVMRVVEHRPYVDIGQLYGTTAGAIRIRVSRALRDLARVLERPGAP